MQTHCNISTGNNFSIFFIYLVIFEDYEHIQGCSAKLYINNNNLCSD